MAIADDLAKLGGLYEKTHEDWELVISYSLTEPTCPAVIIRREGSNALRYCVHRDTIEDGIKAAVELVHREIILGQPVESECPITNPDDHKP